MHQHHFFDWLFHLGSFWHGSRYVRMIAYGLISVAIIVLVGVLSPPKNFPKNSILNVREKASVSEVADYLSSQNVVNSPFVFKVLVKILNNQNGVLSGSYYFADPADIFTVAYRISHGQFDLSPISFIVPEGSNVYQIAERAKEVLPDFDAEDFIHTASPYEGYLFPDTYFFLPDVSNKEIVATMRENFNKKITSLDNEIRASGHTLADIVKMASYLEEEARLTHTRRMVAGILWRRLDLGMPLQIDASFQYVNGKNTYQLTLEDLKEDSPYNTYKYAGFTPTPISSPGLDSLEAAVSPITSKYLYFLSDSEGIMHYATTHDEHVANKDRYLR